jgi:hypothetical protein
MFYEGVNGDERERERERCEIVTSRIKNKPNNEITTIFYYEGLLCIPNKNSYSQE